MTRHCRDRRTFAPGCAAATALTKPVKQSDLLDAIVSVVGGGASAARGTQPAASRKAAPALRILLAEDNPVNQKVVVRTLEREGHRVQVAENGADAIAVWEQQPFDAILMDVQMPEMGGFEATGIIREREKERGTHVPIIAMTAHAMKGDRERCLEAGMDAYIAKPIQPDQVLSAIEGAIEAAGATIVERRSEARTGGPVDEVNVLAGLGGDTKLIGEVLDLFLKE